MLTKARQVGAKIQSGAGVEATLAAIDFSGNRGDLKQSMDVKRAERGLTRASFSQLEKLPGEQFQTIGFFDEMVGGGAAAAAPWHSTMAGLGFDKVAAKMIVVSSVTGGTFKHGQNIGDNTVEGSATKTGVILATRPGASAGLVKIWYIPTLGVIADTDTVYNYAAPQVSAAVDTNPAAGGYRFLPRTESDSYTPQWLTVEERRGGERITIIDALASGSVSLKLGEAPKLMVEYKGIPVRDGATGHWRTASAITGIPAVPRPAALKRQPTIFRLTDGTDYKSILTEIPIDFGLTVSPRATINDNDIGGTGYVGTRHTDRRITTKLDPLRALGATFPYEKLTADGGTFQLICEIGDPAGLNGLIVFHAPACAADGNAEDGDRDGEITSPFSGLFTGSEDDELVVSHLFG